MLLLLLLLLLLVLLAIIGLTMTFGHIRAAARVVSLSVVSGILHLLRHTHLHLRSAAAEKALPSAGSPPAAMMAARSALRMAAMVPA